MLQFLFAKQNITMSSIKTLFFLLVVSTSLQAQTLTERLYTDFEYEYISLDVATLPDGSFYMYSAVKHKDSTDFKTVNLTRLEDKGDFVPGISWDYYLGDSLLPTAIMFPEGNLEVISASEIVMTLTDAEDDKSSHVIFKTDFRGNVDWTKSLTHDQLAKVKHERNRLEYMNNEGFLFHFGSGLNNDDPNIYLNSLDATGTTINHNTYNYPLDPVSNKIYVEQMGQIKQTLIDGGYVFCGMIDTLDSDFFVTKLDSNGIVLWSNRYLLDTTNHLAGNAVDIVEMNVNNYIAAFNWYDSNGKLNGYVSSMDTVGNVLWSKQVSFADDQCEITGIVRNSESDFVISIQKRAPESHGNIMMSSFDLNGNKLWEKTYKESYYLPNFEGQLVKASFQNLVYLTTGFDTSSIDSLPARYLISTGEDGMSDCNFDSDNLIVDSVFVFQKEFTWEVSESPDYQESKVWKKFRQVIPYTAFSTNGRTTYCPEELVDTYLIGTVEGGISYEWKDGTMSDSLKVGPLTGREAFGEYSINTKVINKYCYSLCDTVTLDTFVNLPLDLRVEDNYCDDRTFTISIATPVQSSSIVWSTGETGVISIIVSEAGSYQADATTVNCNFVSSGTANVFINTGPVLDTLTYVEIGGTDCGFYRVFHSNIEGIDNNSIVWSTGETGVSVFPIRISEDGEFIDNWPKGFFEEREEELLF